ncbi:CaiB/BaiF CoA-transferase family protein [Leptospira kmetyi]|uniref:CaiB/BaiF CoA-transferase family protein n=1 Tax=Leptospira kmetyi TaxID=408139 RepID=UPI001082A32E|nr:CoA transferase [Leptospira kmetyi]TGK23311.1 hypothetical protein EHO62_00445 [Leptospira kmetyi]TGK28909.1 hypothetical protein EHO66_11945 [Leptospira kmetyi]TGL71208.1 hypothetical protein EHQ67_04915 [Leptospira kmetyi]
MDHFSQPFKGLRVLEFGNYLSAPILGMLLGDQGADVIRIGSPEGKGIQGSIEQILHRNKRIYKVDLRESTESEKIKNLFRSADIVIENFRPGTMEKFGLDFKSMQKENPKLIYLSMPGFSSSDENSDLPGWEGAIASLAGLYTETNMMRSLLHADPIYTGLPLASVYAAVHGAIAISAVLLKREKTKLGEWIEVPLLSALMSAMGSTVLHLKKQPARYDIPPIPRVLSRLVIPLLRRRIKGKSVEAKEAIYDKASNLLPPFMRSYNCSDGKKLYLFAMDHRKMPIKLLNNLSVLEKLEQEGLVRTHPYISRRNDRNLLDVGTLGRKWKSRIQKVLSEEFAKHPAYFWENRLNEIGIPCAVQRRSEEWFALEELRQASLTILSKEGIVQPGPSIWFSQIPVSEIKAEPPVIESIQPIWKERNVSKDFDIGTTVNGNSLPLSGIRVLDLSTMVAGPSAGRTLSEYGADVIKVDATEPHLGPRMTCWYGIELNQGKRSILIDLSSASGKEAFRKLVAKADVVVNNMRPRAAQGLGVDFESLRAIHPKIICLNLTAFDGPTRGPWFDRPGYDPVLQASSGIMTRYGSLEKPELHAIASCIDYLTGYLGAFGVINALRIRNEQKSAVEVKTSLAQSANLAQIVYSLGGKNYFGTEVSGQLSKGESAIQRLYKAKDGWLFFGLGENKLKNLFVALQSDSVPNIDSDLSPAGPLAKSLERVFSKMNLKEAFHWAKRLDGIAIKAKSLSELRANPKSRQSVNEIFASKKIPSYFPIVEEKHSSGTSVLSVPPLYARFSHFSLRLPYASRKPGSDTRAILSEAGVSPDEFRLLLKLDVVKTEWSRRYLPK